MHKFFVISSIILFVIAAGLASNTAHEFEEYGYLRAAEWRANYLNETLPKIITPPDFVNYVPTTKSIKFTAGLASKKTGPFSIHARSFDDSALHKPIRRSDSGLARRQSGTAANVTYPTFTNSPPLRQTIAESACPSINGTRRASCTVRTYFVAAEEEAWDYAPSGYNHFNGVPFVRDPEGAGVFTLHAENRIGSVYYKTMFYEYEDATFTNRKAKPSWLGGIGPILRAEVGDVIKIVFKNNGTLPYSMHPHGVFYNVSSEGATTQWNQEGTVVAPGTTYNYTWSIPERAGPGPADSSSILWAYHSHNMEVQDVYSGLVGPLLVYKTGTLNPTTDLPNDVDKEYVLMFTVMDENTSHFIGTNIGLQMPRYFNRDTQLPLETAFNDEFKESNLMHSVNFRMYNNLDGLFVSVGDKVRWHVFAMGTEVDLHTVHWHGNTLLHQGSRVDAIELLPASFKTLDMTVDDAGTWLIHCHVADHITAGMVTSFEAFPRTSNSPIVVNNFTTFLADREKVTESPESTPILWNTEDCCSEESNAFFSILNSLIGYRAKATVATVVTYILYWIIIICVWWLFVRKQRVGRGNEKKTSEEGDENSGREDGALLVDEEKAETEGDEVKVVIEAQKEESKSTLLGSEDK
ncbi:Cupredoxin [Cladochytrium replicatum]|nr:Cupredoxin [Cladochytrium replicatum]